MDDARSASQLLLDKLISWYEMFIHGLPNLAVAVVVIFLFGFLARIVARLTDRSLSRVSHNENMVDLLAGIARVVVLFAGVFIALGILNLQKTVFSLLAGLGVMGIALGFAFQDLAANFMAGIMIAFKPPFSRGDLVKIKEHMGWVERIDFRSSNLRTIEGQIVIMPNKDILTTPIVNYGIHGSRRVSFIVGVSYSDDLEKAEAVILGGLAKVQDILETPKPEALLVGFADSSMSIEVRYWVRYPGADYLRVKSNGIIQTKIALESAGYNIPFPIRTLDLAESSPIVEAIGKIESMKPGPDAGAQA